MISRVCRLVWDYPKSGESTYGLQPVFVNLSEEQARQGYDVHVIARLNDNAPREESHNGVNVHRVSEPFSLNAFRTMRKLFGDEKDWVVHTHATCGFFLFPLKRFRDFPLLCHVHGTSRSHNVPIRLRYGDIVMDYSSTKTTVNMLREKLFWSSADRILTVSEAILTDLVDSYGFNRNHIRVVYNGVDTETFRPLEKNDPPDIVQNLAGKKVVLYVGHFGLRKGIFYLIRAMKIIKKSIPDSHLLCVGGAPSWLGKQNYWEYLKKEAALNDVEKEITLLDAVKYQQLVQYYSFARLVALPSYYESFSKVAVEAMACGKPVVATRSGGLPEVVEDGVSGILFRYGSIKDLADAIIHLLGDENVAGDMGRRGRLRAEKLFTWHAVAERIKAVYSELESQNRNLQ